MKRIGRIFLVLLVVLSLVACGGKEEKKVVYVGTNAEFPPFEYLEEGEIVGFDMDLINEISKDQGLEIQIQDMSFDGLLPALQTKKIDIVIAGMTATDERKKSVNFSESYYTASQVIIVKDSDTEISGFDSLKGKKVGVMLGFTGDVVVSEMEGVESKKYNAAYAAIMDLKNDKVDAVVLDSEPATNFVSGNAGIKVVEGEAEKEEYAIAVRKEDGELLDKLNSGLKNLKSSGKYEELIKKHF